MSLPRDPRRDLGLERLGDRDGLRNDHLADAAHVASTDAARRDLLAAYEALIDAVFTAPGAAEWLTGLRMRVAAFLAAKREEPAPRPPTATDAIQSADPERA